MREVRVREGFLQAEHSTGNRISRVLQEVGRMSTSRAPKEPWTAEMGSPKSGKAAGAAWAPGLLD